MAPRAASVICILSALVTASSEPAVPSSAVIEVRLSMCDCCSPFSTLPLPAEHQVIIAKGA
jgi:hypothetical protein